MNVEFVPGDNEYIVPYLLSSHSKFQHFEIIIVNNEYVLKCCLTYLDSYNIIGNPFLA
jgi:hypothetical protein